MSEGITHVGLDAHQETIAVAALLPGVQGAVEDRIANTPETVARWVRLACLDLPARAPPLVPAPSASAGRDDEFLGGAPAWDFDQTAPDEDDTN